MLPHPVFWERRLCDTREGRRKVWIEAGEGRTMEAFAKILKMHLLNAVWWVGDFCSAHSSLLPRGVALLFLSSPFHQLWCLSHPLLILLNKPTWQTTICSSSAGPVFCQVTESYQFTEGSSELELPACAEGVLYERASLPQAVAVSCRLAHHVLRADGRRLISCRIQEEMFLLPPAPISVRVVPLLR